VLVVFSLLVPLFYTRKAPIDHNPIKLQKVILFAIIGVSLLVMIIAHVVAGALYPLYRGVFYLEYIFLLLLLASTATFSKRLIFYLPVFIICLFSLAYIVYFAFDLEKPNSHDIIVMTGNNPLYILRYCPAIQVTNDFEGLRKTNIYQNEKPAPIIKAINSDSGSKRYLLCPLGERDLVTSLKLTKICDCREERILYIVDRE